MLRCGVRERKWVRARARHCKQKAGGGRPVAPRWWQVAAARGLGPALGPATAAASLRRATGTLVLPVVCVSHYDHTFHMYLGASSHYLPQSALGLLICPFGSALCLPSPRSRLVRAAFCRSVALDRARARSFVRGPRVIDRKVGRPKPSKAQGQGRRRR